ncbi:hypothetical protein [Massilia sp. erpn]|uniref:hypothetical protein n=1 Tax=Massilia sp. erpn TaxID=2738142 RepID=UPI002103486C|nr:hypothetical protein [Massilia sp. erpn]UTY59517.1 hypothetical protein HPQ68_21470 [Massilia sp. erpn]
MVVFTRLSTCDFLYAADSGKNDGGWLAYLLPAGTDPSSVPASFDLHASFYSYGGSYLFCDAAPDLASRDLAAAFIVKVRNALDEAGPSMVWLLDLMTVSAKSICSLQFSSSHCTVVGPLSAAITTDLSFGIRNSSSITLTDKGFTFSATGSGGGVVFSSRNGQGNWRIVPNSAALYLSGQGRGGFQFKLYITPRFDFDLLKCGLRYCFAKSAGQPDPTSVLRQAYPFLDTSQFGAAETLGLLARLNPGAVQGPERSFLCFTGKSYASPGKVLPDVSEPTRLFSTFVTDSRHPLILAPLGWDGADGNDPPPHAARLVFTRYDLEAQKSRVYYMAPHGDFRLGLKPEFSKASAPPALLAGIAGTETLGFTPYTDIAGNDGDCLSFIAYQPAYAAIYPLPQLSPTGKPPGDGAALSSLYQTSWVNLIKSQSTDVPVAYYSQPKGASLYNNATRLYRQTQDYLGYFETAAALAQDRSFCFPLAPYAGTVVSREPNSFSFKDIQGFEMAILNPMRKQLIQDTKKALPIAHSLKRRKLDSGDIALLAAGQTVEAATPQGLLASVDTADSSWSKLLLARNAAYALQFENLPAALKDAFQSNQLMLVVSDARNIGALRYNSQGNPVTPAPSGAVFDNRMAIEEWLFSIVTPSSQSATPPVYGDYSNVMLFKFCHGTLSELVQNPRAWTDAANFNDTGGMGEAGLTGIATWMGDYFAQAKAQAAFYPEYFQNFCRIVDDPNWNGILVLRSDVAHLPSSIQGLMAGVVYPKDFYVHHFGVEINPVKTDASGKVELKENSSLFGLINYVDADYRQQRAAGKGEGQPVPPRTGSIYDFKVLYFQALFINSAVAKFGSKTQLTCNQLYKEITATLNGQSDHYNSMLIEGSYQNQNGKPVYVFATQGNNAYGFTSSIFNAVNITQGRFNTVSDGSNGGEVVSVFSLSGKLDFRKVKGLDLFSFGSEGGAEARDPKGLAFTNVFIRMHSRLADGAITEMSFDTSGISFNVAESDARQNSLYPNFALDLKGLISGDAQTSAQSKGYLRLQSDTRITGTVGTWYALDCSLNMGSPGALASAAGLVSSMALCWSPSAVSDGDEPSYKVYLGLKLPGSGGDAKLLSLQGVLKLSIGEMKLSYLEGQQAYMMVLYDIALKFLGLVQIPPLNGRTSFFLFGGPKGAASKVSELGWYAVYNVDPPKLEGGHG